MSEPSSPEQLKSPPKKMLEDNPMQPYLTGSMGRKLRGLINNIQGRTGRMHSLTDEQFKELKEKYPPNTPLSKILQDLAASRQNPPGGTRAGNR